MWGYIITIIVLVLIICYMLYFCIIKKRNAAEDFFAAFIDTVYKDRVLWFKTLNKYVTGRPSVFVGDSLTNEYLLTEIFKEHNVCNRGIGGDTTVGVLKRMDVSVYDLNPKQVFLLIGGNDFQLNKTPIETVVENINEICNKTIQAISDVEIYIISLYPIRKDEIFADKKNSPDIDPDEVIRETNRQLVKLCNAKKFNYLDFYSVLADETKSIKKEYTRDGMHLSPLGYEIISEELLKYLPKM